MKIFYFVRSRFQKPTKPTLRWKAGQIKSWPIGDPFQGRDGLMRILERVEKKYTPGMFLLYVPCSPIYQFCMLGRV